MSNHIKYDRHQEHWDAAINDPETKKVASTWLNQSNTLDRWRHNRMYSTLKPIIEDNPEASWLTVGDGRFGTDAHNIIEMGAKSVHASDISDTLLKVGNEKGFIQSYSAENAEALSFADNSFDFVYCKEAYHHFPRPYIALNEMFRVAKQGVILCEPRDTNIDLDLFHGLLQMIKILMRKPLMSHGGFEDVGNYIYRLSEKEMEKFLLGMHYNIIAFQGINDAYESGIEFIDLNSTDHEDKKRIKRIKRKIFFQDLLQKFRFRKSAILMTILFKKPSNASIFEKIATTGWKTKILPKNPYLSP